MNTTVVLVGGLSLRHNFAWTFAGNVVYAASQWAIVVLIAKITTTADLGKFALALAVTAPIMIFAYQGLRELQATDARRTFEFRDYVRYRLLCVGFAISTIGTITYFLHYPAVVVVVGISKSLEAISDLAYGRYQQHERMDWVGTSMMLRSICSVSAVAALLSSTHAIGWGVAGLVGANAAVLAIYDLPHVRRMCRSSVKSTGDRRPSLREHRFGQTLWALAVLGAPLGLAQMLNSFSVNVPRYFLERYTGEATLGIFAAIMYLIIAGRTVISAVAQSCVARLSREFADGNLYAFRSLLHKQLALALACGVAGVIFSLTCGHWFLRLLYKPEYAAHTDILLLAMIAAAANYLAEFMGLALMAVRAIRIQPLLLGICVMFAGLACSILVPGYGMLGAAWACVLTGVCQLALYAGVLVPIVYSATQRDHRTA